jgi:hypothetical protein
MISRIPERLERIVRIRIVMSISMLAASSLFSAAITAQRGKAPGSARAGIDAGNQAWIDGVKTGDITLITATYAEDAVDCGPTGECIRGRLQIERHMRTQLTSLGRARSATGVRRAKLTHLKICFATHLLEAGADRHHIHKPSKRSPLPVRGILGLAPSAVARCCSSKGSQLRSSSSLRRPGRPSSHETSRVVQFSMPTLSSVHLSLVLSAI